MLADVPNIQTDRSRTVRQVYAIGRIYAMMRCGLKTRTALHTPSELFYDSIAYIQSPPRQRTTVSGAAHLYC